MDNTAIRQIIEAAQTDGWIPEPQTKEILRLAGLPVPRFEVVKTLDECHSTADKIGYPLAAKVVSQEIIHKTEYGGVAVNINDQSRLEQVFSRFSELPGFQGMLIETMLSGVELIAGAKNDPQFGPVILLGIGGTGVEIYRDTAIRMAPLTADDVQEMIEDLKGKALLTGHRGTAPINRDSLIETMILFSQLSMELADHFESIDINPLFCSEHGCSVADARIMLK